MFFVALAVPTALLIAHAYGQLKWEAFHQYRQMAEELGDRIRTALDERLGTEEARGFADYGFLVAAGDPSANFVQRSPLADFPLSIDLPGAIGYFQVDAEGDFSTPLLPPTGTDAEAFGINGAELRQRVQLATRIHSILGRNRLVRATGGRGLDEEAETASEASMGKVQATDEVRVPGTAPVVTSAASIAPEVTVSGQAVFDQLNRAAAPGEPGRQRKAAKTLGRVEDLRLDQQFEADAVERKSPRTVVSQAEQAASREVRKELSALPQAVPAAPPSLAASPAVADEAAAKRRIHVFESEIDPFEFSRLESGHFVLFRKVWRDGQRYVQGLLIDQQAFLKGMIEQAFRATALSQMSDLIAAFQGDVVGAFSGGTARELYSSASDLRGDLLYQTRMGAPFGDLQLIFSINRLPATPGGAIVTWLAVVLALILCGGFFLLYRLGLGQIRLARQQQDFVSAVSHELKTPLTSIRMYGEMLREGWAPEEKKREYYDYIHDESERLTRLINNVLQLARMTRNNIEASLKPVSAGELMNTVRSKIDTRVERAGFTLRLDCPDDVASATVNADRDYFTQIVINLVDNAIKFSAKAKRPAIDLGCHRQRDGSVVFTVRDYGPGIPRDQMKKIFRLFYRSESELTRETLGTGIGLALVSQMVAAMDGKVDVVNVDPGAEFRFSLPGTAGG